MNQISLCASVMSPNSDCQLCLRNPAITKPSKDQTWVKPELILKGMGEDDCLDFVFKQNKEVEGLCLI